jgi:hypothetical protein
MPPNVLEKPKISVKVAEVFDVQESDKAEFTYIRKLGEAIIPIQTFFFRLTILLTLLVLLIYHKMEPLNVPAGQQTIYNLTLQNPKEAVNYNNIR